MAYEQRDNSGSLFVNDRKQQDNHPDRTGKAMIGGVEYYVNGWLKTSQRGDPFLSLSFKPVDQSGGGRQTGGQRAPAQTGRAPARAATPIHDDEIPF